MNKFTILCISAHVLMTVLNVQVVQSGGSGGGSGGGHGGNGGHGGDHGGNHGGSDSKGLI